MNKQKKLVQYFQKFVDRTEYKEIKKFWISHEGIKKNFFYFIYENLINLSQFKQGMLNEMFIFNFKLIKTLIICLPFSFKCISINFYIYNHRYETF